MEKKPLHILVVDDLFANRFLMKEILRMLGHQMIEASNGKEALEILANELPDMVFTDIEMPVMNGLEVIRNIRESSDNRISSLKVIALTAHNPEIFFDDYKDVYFDEILTKPYTIERVSALIERTQNK